MSATLADPRRRQLLAKVHMGKASLKMDDVTYRAMLSRVVATDSARDLPVGRLIIVVEELKRLGWADKPKAPKRAGTRSMAGDPQSVKIRALWMALYHLGELRDPAESALAAFAKRQTGVDALQFLTVGQARRVIEVLKSWCARIGYTIPEGSAKLAKVELLRAQWRRLIAAGANEVDGAATLDAWLAVAGCLPNTTTVSFLTLDQLDQAAEVLGKRVRRAVGKGANFKPEVTK